MGHSTSRHNALAGDGQPPLPSRFSRFRTRLRLRRRDRAAASADCSDSESGRPAVAADEFAGIARIRIVKVRRSNPVRATSPADLDRGFVCELPIGGLLSVLCWFDFWWCVWTLAQADMRFKDKFFACLSLGERTYRTERSDKFSNTHLFFSSSSLPQTSLLN
jgi:phosphatidylserine decarboxylase